MSQITNLAFFRARPGQTQALGAALAALVEPTRAAQENLSYDLHQSRDDADVWLVVENWRSAEGLEAHMRTPYLLAFLDAAPGLLVGDIEQRRFAMITKPTAFRA